MSDLKPCPFCGGTAKLRRVSEPRPDAKPDSFSVKCTVCCAESNWFKTDGYALEAWNTRADHSEDMRDMVKTADNEAKT